VPGSKETKKRPGAILNRMESLLSTSVDPDDTFVFERLLLARGFSRVAGTDEVGRGPLAGPVVAASVILPPDCDHSRFCDSKQTTETQRYKLRDLLYSVGAAIGIGSVSAGEVDKINILQASLQAMKHSIESLGDAESAPDFILVDGTFEVPIDTPQETLVKGDSRSASIAAASIVAKIARDEIMKELHLDYPQYNFIANKGYPTREHREAVSLHGPSPVHRLSFRGVREFVAKTD
jgi:ribonuclease HII